MIAKNKRGKYEVDSGFDISLTDANKVRISVGVQGLVVPMDFTPDEAREVADELLVAAVETDNGSQRHSPVAPEDDSGPEIDIDKFINGVIGKEVKEVRAGLQINPTDWNAVRMTFYLNDFVLPLEFPPVTAMDIARDLLDTAERAEDGQRAGAFASDEETDMHSMSKTGRPQVDTGFNILLTDTNKVRIEVGVDNHCVPMDLTPDQAREIANDLLCMVSEMDDGQRDSPAADEDDSGPELDIENFVNGVIGRKVKASMEFGPTDRSTVRITFYLNDFVLPLEFPPDTTRKIARKLRDTAERAEGG